MKSYERFWMLVVYFLLLIMTLTQCHQAERLDDANRHLRELVHQLRLQNLRL